ncbi:MAG: 30S ribosomal protein S16 [Kiritimatiellales bacterium]|nr:30S ribosomal protein S16 [Kiritimatiellales bacterium]
MAVKLRLRRMGARNKPFFRVTVSDSRRPPTGKFIETLGWYDPKQEGSNFSLNLERIDYWLGNGAQMSDTVKSLVKKARTMPVEAVVGEVKEEEVPMAAMEAVEVAEEVEVEVAEEVEEPAVAVEDVPETEPVAEEPAADEEVKEQA